MFKDKDLVRIRMEEALEEVNQAIQDTGIAYSTYYSNMYIDETNSMCFTDDPVMMKHTIEMCQRRFEESYERFKNLKMEYESLVNGIQQDEVLH